MLQNLFGKSSTKHGFKWIEAWRNETRNQFSVVLKEIQTNKFSIRNFIHNTVIENLVEFPSNTLIHSFDSGFPENNKLIHEKKNEIFLISLTWVDRNTMNQTVSIISAADIVLDSVRNSLLIPYISSYRNHKTTIDELEQVLTLRADDLGISILSVAINKEKESVNELDYSSENSRDSFSSEETHDSLEIPADHTDDHFKLYEEKNTNPLENSDLIVKPFCEPKPIFALPIDTQQIIGDKSVDNDTQDNAVSRKFISVPTETCDSGEKSLSANFIKLSLEFTSTSQSPFFINKRDNSIINKASTPKHKRNRSIKRYIYSSQDSSQSDPELIADTALSSPSPINPQPLKRNKRAASSPLHPLIRSNIGAPVNNINSESGKIWNNAKIISHESHDKKPLNHGKDSHGNSREPLPTDNNHNNETLTSLNDIDNSNNINNNLPVSNILELGEAVISDKEDYTFMSIGQSSPLFLPKENVKEPFSSFTFNQDYPSKGNVEDNQQFILESCNQYVRDYERFLLTEEEIYNKLKTFSNTLSSPDLFASYIFNLQYIEPPVQITPLFIFDKFRKNDRNVFKNLKSSYRNYLQYHRKFSFLQQYDAAIHKIFSMYRNKQSVIDILGEKEEELISGLHLHYVWEYLIKLVSPTGYSPNHLEGLVRILRRNLNRFSSIQYKELDIIDETVKQYQAGKRVNNIFNKSSSFDKSKVYQDKGKHTVDDSVKSQMEGISYDTSTTQQSFRSENFDLFKDSIPSYPCIDKSVVEEDTFAQQLKQFMNSMHNVETFVNYILKLKDIKFLKLSLPKSIQSFLLSGKSFFKSFRSFNKPEHQISFESSLNEAINNYIQTTGSSSCSKSIRDILKSQVIIRFGWILLYNEISTFGYNPEHNNLIQSIIYFLNIPSSKINWFKFFQLIKLKFTQNKLILPQNPDNISEEIKSSISNFIPIKNFSSLQSVRNILGQHYIIDQLPTSFFHESYKPSSFENNNKSKTNTFKTRTSLKPSLPFNPREVNKQLNISLPITNTNDIVPIKNLLRKHYYFGNRLPDSFIKISANRYNQSLSRNNNNTLQTQHFSNNNISEEIKSSISNFIPIKNFSSLQSVRNILGQHYIIDQLPTSFFHESYKPSSFENNNKSKTNTFKTRTSLKPSLPFNPREVNKQLNISLPITNTNDIVPIKNLLRKHYYFGNRLPDSFIKISANRYNQSLSRNNNNTLQTQHFSNSYLNNSHIYPRLRSNRSFFRHQGRQYKESNKGGYGPTDIPPSSINSHANNTIKIGTHNIRGINTTHKQMLFSHYLETHNFDIVGISETKLKESATNFAFKEQDIYKCFWSSNDLEPRGTGVGLFIKKDIAKHIQKKSSRIYQIQIRKLIAEETKKNTKIIIMGDFNAVVLPHLDRLSRGKDKFPTPSYKPEIPLFDFFKDWAFTDLQATWQGDKRTFTWKNSLSESRIDQIWFSPDIITNIHSFNNTLIISKFF
ncbi:hypothetical protein Glove_481g74 [Diversispora epigaea]|uniref:Endonuclease/exonuclease/phosphatase domain-containing protein n=1 Tax=Diversispora epigaea TaxID=1348612 RepID=A0A397GQH1_9GLOM|nr:hypothetical protein Glove_481g74 [Diversispora epigaea]